MLIVKTIKVPTNDFTKQFFLRTYSHHFIKDPHYKEVIDLRKDDLMKTLFLGALNKSNVSSFQPIQQPACFVKFALPSSWSKYEIDDERQKYLKKALEDIMHKFIVQQFSILETVTTWEKASEIILDLLDMPGYSLDHIHRYFSRYGTSHLGMDRKLHKQIIKDKIQPKVSV